MNQFDKFVISYNNNNNNKINGVLYLLTTSEVDDIRNDLRFHCGVPTMSISPWPGLIVETFFTVFSNDLVV